MRVPWKVLFVVLFVAGLFTFLTKCDACGSGWRNASRSRLASATKPTAAERQPADHEVAKAKVWQDHSKEGQLLAEALRSAEAGDPESVLATVNQFCSRRNGWMMHVGPEKGEILDTAVRNKRPKVAVELGTYCGYGATRIARLLPDGGHLYSIELNAANAERARKLIAHAGLSDRVTVIEGTAATAIPLLMRTYNVENVDLLFIDHAKDMYLPDFQRFEASGLLRSGAVAVADNAIYPGCPNYLEYVRAHRQWRSTFHESKLEFSDKIDGVEVSVMK